MEIMIGLSSFVNTLQVITAIFGFCGIFATIALLATSEYYHGRYEQDKSPSLHMILRGYFKKVRTVTIILLTIWAITTILSGFSANWDSFSIPERVSKLEETTQILSNRISQLSHTQFENYANQ